MKRILITTLSLLAFLFVMGYMPDAAEAKKKGPKAYMIKQVEAKGLDKTVITKELNDDWTLGGVYTDCGVSTGGGLSKKGFLEQLLAYYEEAAKKSDDEVMEVLNSLFPREAEKKFKEIEAGKKKLTDSGSIYEQVQKNYEDTHRQLNEVKKVIAAKDMDKSGNVDELLASLKEFNEKGYWRDIKQARADIKALSHILKKFPDDVRSKQKSSGDNLAEIENIRTTVEKAMKKIDDLGGTGCMEIYVFYKEVK